MVERFERFSLAISDISRYWHKIAAEEMEKYDLKGTHSIYLTVLYRYPEGVTAAKLCELCGRDKAEVSRTLAIMEKKGLVSKAGNSYRALLYLTDTGKLAAEHVRQRAALAVEVAGKDLSDGHRKIFYSALESITYNLKTISEAGLPVSKIKE